MATTQLKVLQCPSAEPDRWVTAVEDPSNYATAAGAPAATMRASGTSIPAWWISVWWTGSQIHRMASVL